MKLTEIIRYIQLYKRPSTDNIEIYRKQPVACPVTCQSCKTFPGLTSPGFPDSRLPKCTFFRRNSQATMQSTSNLVLKIVQATRSIEWSPDSFNSFILKIATAATNTSNL